VRSAIRQPSTALSPTSRRAARHIEFDLDAPVDIMIDGEVLTLHCRSLDILPAALDVYI
jgi:diacylglycerol kinase family enzyme